MYREVRFRDSLSLAWAFWIIYVSRESCQNDKQFQDFSVISKYTNSLVPIFPPHNIYSITTPTPPRAVSSALFLASTPPAMGEVR